MGNSVELAVLLLTAVAALLVGAAVARWHASGARRAVESELQRAREELATATAQRDAAREQIVQLTQDRETLKEAFGSIASDQLKSHRDEFLKQANVTFSKSEEKHTGELEKRHEAISEKFEAVTKTVREFEELHRKLEKQRTDDFSSLREQVFSLRRHTEKLGESSTALETALRGSSQSRGRWGEMALRNIVEAAGMTEHCDFSEQTSDAAGNRPDLVVMLPGEVRIPIDAKVPYNDYERMVEEKDPDARERLLHKHGEVVRNTMLDLAKRDYPGQIEGEIDFTVMFIPIESVAAAAFEARPHLQQEAIEKGVLIATPVTLIALLRTVGVYWRQEKIARDAKQIWEASKELHKRLKTFQGHLAKSGRGLVQAVDAFNKSVGSLESSVLPQGRRIEQLAAIEPTGSLPETPRIETQVRSVSAPEEQE